MYTYTYISLYTYIYIYTHTEYTYTCARRELTTTIALLETSRDGLYILHYRIVIYRNIISVNINIEILIENVHP